MPLRVWRYIFSPNIPASNLRFNLNHSRPHLVPGHLKFSLTWKVDVLLQHFFLANPTPAILFFSSSPGKETSPCSISSRSTWCSWWSKLPNWPKGPPTWAAMTTKSKCLLQFYFNHRRPDLVPGHCFLPHLAAYLLGKLDSGDGQKCHTEQEALQHGEEGNKSQKCQSHKNVLHHEYQISIECTGAQTKLEYSAVRLPNVHNFPNENWQDKRPTTNKEFELT